MTFTIHGLIQEQRLFTSSILYFIYTLPTSIPISTPFLSHIASRKSSQVLEKNKTEKATYIKSGQFGRNYECTQNQYKFVKQPATGIAENMSNSA